MVLKKDIKPITFKQLQKCEGVYMCFTDYLYHPDNEFRIVVIKNPLPSKFDTNPKPPRTQVFSVIGNVIEPYTFLSTYGPGCFIKVPETVSITFTRTL